MRRPPPTTGIMRTFGMPLPGLVDPRQKKPRQEIQQGPRFNEAEATRQRDAREWLDRNKALDYYYKEGETDSYLVALARLLRGVYMEEEVAVFPAVTMLAHDLGRIPVMIFWAEAQTTPSSWLARAVGVNNQWTKDRVFLSGQTGEIYRMILL